MGQCRLTNFAGQGARQAETAICEWLWTLMSRFCQLWPRTAAQKSPRSGSDPPPFRHRYFIFVLICLWRPSITASGSQQMRFQSECHVRASLFLLQSLQQNELVNFGREYWGRRTVTGSHKVGWGRRCTVACCEVWCALYFAGSLGPNLILKTQQRSASRVPVRSDGWPAVQDHPHGCVLAVGRSRWRWTGA